MPFYMKAQEEGDRILHDLLQYQGVADLVRDRANHGLYLNGVFCSLGEDGPIYGDGLKLSFAGVFNIPAGDQFRMEAASDISVLIDSILVLDYGMEDDHILYNAMFNGAVRTYADYMESHKPPNVTYDLQKSGLFYLDENSDLIQDEDYELIGRDAALSANEWLYCEMTMIGWKPELDEMIVNDGEETE